MEGRKGDTFSLMTCVLSDTEKVVVETIRMRLTTPQALQYSKDNGFPMSRATYFRHKRIVQEKKFERLYHIANLGFEDQHLQRIDGLEIIEKKMWQEYNKEKDPFKRVQILKDIAQVQPFLSAYYDATKYVIDNRTNRVGLIGERNMENSIKEEKSLMEAEEYYRKQKEKAVF